MARGLWGVGAGLAGAGLSGCRQNVSTGLAPSTSAAFPAALSAEDIHVILSGFSVNLESWWRDIPFERRFDQAATSGFSHAEMWFVDSWNRRAVELKKHIPEGLNMSQIVGDTPALARLDVRAEFIENCKRAIENAQILNSPVVTLTGHQNVDGISQSDALKSYQDHMAAIAPLFEAAKIYAAIEPFNPYNHPGHFIYGHAEALRICQEVDSPFLKLNWDLFHMQRHEGNLIDNFNRGADHVCYVQIADSPDRHQPGTGEIDHRTLIRAIRKHYDGPIGLELFAKDDDAAAALADIINLGAAL